ncbi:MAG: SDR family NAD(P)-dependent oxidoreductase [Actinomycetota bacterium]
MAGALEGKTAVVTGGANGIGRACCERFAREGAAVVVADLQEDRVTETVDALVEAGATASGVRLDAVSREDNEGMIAHAVDAHGSVDVLVTAAGVSHGEYVSGEIDKETARIEERMAAIDRPWEAALDLDVADWQRVLDVNLTGTFHAAQLAVRWMIEDERPGSIVTIASIAAKDPTAGPLAYCTSKAGVWMMTKHLARSVAPTGVRVNAIGPGYIQTNMTAALDEVEGMDELLLMRIPALRKGTPDEVANVAMFLAGPESSYVTGALLHPHGGWFTD